MHFISWFIMIGILIGGLISNRYDCITGVCIAMGLCSIADGLYYIGKIIKEEVPADDGSEDNR